MASRRRSTSVSTRLTKNDATEWTSEQSPPEVSGGPDRRVRVVCQAGRKLERDEPVAAVGMVMERSQDAQCFDDVVDHHRPVGVLHVRAELNELCELLVVVVGFGDRLLEDGR